jgi:hypothetical protein
MTKRGNSAPTIQRHNIWFRLRKCIRRYLADEFTWMNSKMRRIVVHTTDVKSRGLQGAVEAADAVDERNEPLAHIVLENAARFPQLPQPSSSAGSRTGQSTRAGHTLPAALRGLEYGVHLTIPACRVDLARSLVHGLVLRPV